MEDPVEQPQRHSGDRAQVSARADHRCILEPPTNNLTQDPLDTEREPSNGRMTTFYA
jgi:hypothetical protein